mmetsp:Transcript_16153/g.27106  ORF Transcript_16153/g.27106 Transcript_16153/m.27106 type:complete len:319 (+) Transcript_16153:35-991(+)
MSEVKQEHGGDASELLVPDHFPDPIIAEALRAFNTGRVEGSGTNDGDGVLSRCTHNPHIGPCYPLTCGLVMKLRTGYIRAMKKTILKSHERMNLDYVFQNDNHHRYGTDNGGAQDYKDHMSGRLSSVILYYLVDRFTTDKELLHSRWRYERYRNDIGHPHTTLKQPAPIPTPHEYQTGRISGDGGCCANNRSVMNENVMVGTTGSHLDAMRNLQISPVTSEGEIEEIGMLLWEICDVLTARSKNLTPALQRELALHPLGNPYIITVLEPLRTSTQAPVDTRVMQERHEGPIHNEEPQQQQQQQQQLHQQKRHQYQLRP